jgi:hypothetical protein
MVNPTGASDIPPLGVTPFKSAQAQEAPKDTGGGAKKLVTAGLLDQSQTGELPPAQPPHIAAPRPAEATPPNGTRRRTPPRLNASCVSWA